MQLLNHKNKIKKLKKSQILLLGSLLVFFGCFVLTRSYFVKLKEEVFNDMKISFLTKDIVTDGEETEVPVADNLPNDTTIQKEEVVVDYSKYFGILEIPRIGLKRGFYNLDSKYNDIEYNVTMVRGSQMPDVDRGNLILMAHSGDAYISYFAYLYYLQIGNSAYITYNGNKYTYNLVNKYDVEKNGTVKIFRSYDKTTLTLITCTKNNDTLQTVYIFELV